MKGTSMNDATPDQAVSPAIRAQLAREVLGRYAIACDTGDEAALGALFHPEATAVYDKDADLTGNTQIAAWVIGATAHLVWQQHALGVMPVDVRSDEHTSELQSLMRVSYAVFCLQKQRRQTSEIRSPRHRADQGHGTDVSTQRRARKASLT